MRRRHSVTRRGDDAIQTEPRGSVDNRRYDRAVSAGTGPGTDDLPGRPASARCPISRTNTVASSTRSRRSSRGSLPKTSRGRRREAGRLLNRATSIMVAAQGTPMPVSLSGSRGIDRTASAHRTRAPTVCKVCKSARRTATGHRRPAIVCKVCNSGTAPHRGGRPTYPIQTM